MKNKKGFTLIELLAVIAILAILVVIAVPSVLKLFNKGKESAFDTQAKNVFKIAQTQFVSDQLGTGSKSTYCFDGDTIADVVGYGKLDDMDAGANLKYLITFSGDVIIDFRINDGKNFVGLTGTTDVGVKVEDIKSDTSLDIPGDEITCP
ncbi:MAG: type II secretion system protein [Bacilli bacterium]